MLFFAAATLWQALTNSKEDSAKEHPPYGWLVGCMRSRQILTSYGCVSNEGQQPDCPAEQAALALLLPAGKDTNG